MPQPSRPADRVTRFDGEGKVYVRQQGLLFLHQPEGCCRTVLSLHLCTSPCYMTFVVVPGFTHTRTIDGDPMESTNMVIYTCNVVWQANGKWRILRLQTERQTTYRRIDVQIVSVVAIS